MCFVLLARLSCSHRTKKERESSIRCEQGIPDVRLFTNIRCGQSNPHLTDRQIMEHGKINGRVVEDLVPADEV